MPIQLTRPVRLTLLVAVVAIGIAVAMSASFRDATDSELRLVSSTIATTMARVIGSLVQDASAQIAVPRRAGIGVSRDAFVREFQQLPVSFGFNTERMASGEAYVSGSAVDGNGILLLYGPADNLSQAALGVQLGRPGTTLLQRFRRVADPAWLDGDSWLAASVRDGVSYHRVTFGAHVYTLLVTRESGSALLSVASPDEGSERQLGQGEETGSIFMISPSV